MIRKLKSGQYRLYSRKVNPKTSPAMNVVGSGSARKKLPTSAIEVRIRLFQNPVFNTKILAWREARSETNRCAEVSLIMTASSLPSLCA